MERMATDCEKIDQEVAYRFQGRNNYFRLSVEQGLQQRPTLEPLTLSQIEAHTRSYLRSLDTNKTVDLLVTSLLKAIEASSWITTRDIFEETINGYITEYTTFAEDIPVDAVRLVVLEGVMLLKTIRVCISPSCATYSHSDSALDHKI
jgi:hypothetical protein